MNSENKLLVISALVCLALFLGVFFLFFFTEKRAAEGRELLASAKRFDAERESMRAIERMLRETEDTRRNLDAYFVEAGKAVYFIEKIESIGKSAGLSVSLSNAAVPEKTESLRIDMTAEGTFENTLHFIKLLESIPYKLAVERVNIRTKGGTSPGREEGSAASSSVPVWSSSFSLVLESYIGDTTR